VSAAEQKIPLPKEPTKFTYVWLMLPQIPAAPCFIQQSLPLRQSARAEQKKQAHHQTARGKNEMQERTTRNPHDLL
jgi:hypothetical protein